jgi:hypothetical protein
MPWTSSAVTALAYGPGRLSLYRAQRRQRKDFYLAVSATAAVCLPMLCLHTPGSVAPGGGDLRLDRMGLWLIYWYV